MINLENHPDLIQSIGWTDNDFYLFYYWITLDKAVYSESSIQTLVSGISTWNNNILSVVETLKESLFSHPTLDFLYLSLSTWLFLILGTRQKRLTLTALGLGWLVMATFFVLAWGFKLPNRVSISILASFSILTFFLPLWLESTPKIAASKDHFSFAVKGGLILALFTLGLTWGLVIRPVQYKRIYDVRNTLYSQYLMEIDEQIQAGVFTPNDLILAPNAGFPFLLMDPLKLDYPPLDILSGGWNRFSPAYEMEFINHGLRSDPKSFVDQANFYLVTLSSITPRIELFYKENYGMKIRCRVVYTLGQSGLIDPSVDPTVVYRLEKVE